VYGRLGEDLASQLAEATARGTLKRELELSSPQAAYVNVGEQTLLNLCSNNYLGLANHPEVLAAAREALDRWGFGLASVRFICGTQTVHRELEERIAEFLGVDDAILFPSCFDANGGLFEALLSDDDAVISDALNHASIIDGIRLSKVRRLRYANGDLDELEARLRESSDARYRLIATDGVFSMDGHLAKLDQICDLAEAYDALLMVDDSHAVGVVGPNGRGTPEFHGVGRRVDVLTGTLGKALGGASGGYVAGRREIVALLRQRARPYLFSNTVAPVVVGASLKALALIDGSPLLRDRLRANTAYFRAGITAEGFDILQGEHPIVPVMIGDELAARDLSQALIERGVYEINFSHPVVPRGTARIRAQVSAAHTTQDLDFAVEQFVAAREPR
jgi:glycine C-acetyltransferase